MTPGQPIDGYLAALEDRLRAMRDLIVGASIRHEIDAQIEFGFVEGHVSFVDGSRLEFVEQLPVSRRKFRLHYMDAANQLILRWDSAPHHRELDTFPFHKHTPAGVERSGPMTALAVLDEVFEHLKLSAS